jgi:hypothetical protein
VPKLRDRLTKAASEVGSSKEASALGGLPKGDDRAASDDQSTTEDDG